MKAKIIDIKKETENVRTYKFDIRPMFAPGQFVFISANINGENVKRAYSIASLPNEALELTIELTKNGKLTTFLFEHAKEGEVFEISEPIGKFTLNDEKKIALIAGGSGIVPFRSMINYLIKNNPEKKATLFYSVKRFEDITYYKELKNLQDKNKNLRILYTLTKEAPEDWKGSIGRFNIEMMLDNLEEPKEHTFFICGPNEMVKFFSSELKNLGLKVKIELWG